MLVMKKVKELSVFFPVLNEEANIEKTVTKALPVLEQVAEKYEVIVVNDGSTDKTGEIAIRLAKQNANVRVVNLHPNLGYGAALRAGFYGAKYPLIVYTDGDGQFDFSEITKFIAVIDDVDAVWGYRIKRMDPPIRLLNAKGWKFLIWLFFGLPIRDVDCGFKMIKRSVLDCIPKLESTRGGMINPELLVKISRAGLTYTQVGVNHYPRTAGNPTGAAPKVIITSFIELFKLWWKNNVKSMYQLKTAKQP